MSDLFDITIIGGGPVGLFTAFYAHLRQAKVKIIDSLPQLGGQPAILYPEKNILDIAGFPTISGQGLTDCLLKQIAPFQTKVHLNETVLAIEKKENSFCLQTTKGEHLTKTLIIAIGGGAFKPRGLELEGADTFDNIHYHVSDIKQYQNQRVVVLGGGDSAVDWSLAFDAIGSQTTIIHRRENFRALEHSVDELRQSPVTIKTPFIPTGLVTEKGRVTHLEVTRVKSTDIELIPLDHLFVNFGFKSSIGHLKQWGLELNRHKISVNRQQVTSVPGIFAVGDCCFYEGKIDLIATGFGEAPIAVNHAIQYINPTEKVQPKHSTSL